MKKLIVVIIAIIYHVGLIEGCPSSKEKRKIFPLAEPSKSFIVDEDTPVYFVGKTHNSRYTLKSINMTKNIKYMEFHKKGSDFEPYTLFLKTQVIVDFPMVSDYGEQLLDRIMAYMAFTELEFDHQFAYPKFKIIVTSIVIPMDPEVLSFLTPYYDVYSYTILAMKDLKMLQQWLSNRINFGVTRDYDFTHVITSASVLRADGSNLPLNNIRYGTFNCRSSTNSSTIFSIDLLERNDYYPVASTFEKFIQNSFICRNRYEYNERTEVYDKFPRYPVDKLQKQFNTSWPSCLYELPEFWS